MIIGNKIDEETLYDSMNKCKRGVIWKDSVSSFVLRGLENVYKLWKSIINNKYRPSKVKTFQITSPKERTIASNTFRDRVYQRTLNDNIIYPTITNSFIFDNYACQLNKGTDKARYRLKEFIHKCYMKYGTDFYVLQIDIKGYYPNMSHETVEEMFKNKLDDDTYDKVYDILKCQYNGDIGYNPGSQLIQIAGIGLLNKLDHFIKEKLHTKYYIRYMDDLILMNNSKEYLFGCMNEIETQLKPLGFNYNPTKTKIYPIVDGIPFLGFIFSVSNTGKVYMHILPQNIKNKKLHLRRLVNKAKIENIPKNKIDESYNSWRNHASKGDSYKMLQRMDKYYRDLWKEEN